MFNWMEMNIGVWPSAKFLLLLVGMMMILRSEYTWAAIQSRNETDRLALLNFKAQISEDPQGVLESWNDSVQHCKWPGITCNVRHGRVTALTLTGMSLFGPISPNIGNLSFLKFIQLGSNRFHGEIPREISHLFRLRTLNLTRNMLTGKLPLDLSRCTELRIIQLNWNMLHGKIPAEIGNFKKLVVLFLAVNNFTGRIPASIGNLSSLQKIALTDNNLEGDLPREFGLLTTLSVISMGSNDFSGTVPPSIYNISTLTSFGIGGNSFHGNLPADIGLKLPNLEWLGVGENQFEGTIPPTITNASKLQVIALLENRFEGHVPNSLGNLVDLRELNLELNLLGSNSPDDFEFVASLTNCSNLRTLALDVNNLGGELPKIIGNLSFRLQELYIGNNKISGSIPRELASLTNLYGLGTEFNFFSGIIPSDFGKFQELQAASFHGNRFSGNIPSIFCNITSLYELDLAENYFQGTLPPCLGKCQNLKTLALSGNSLTGAISPLIFGMFFSPIVLDLSSNSLDGSLPVEVGRLRNVNRLRLSYNNFSGEIPVTLGDCTSLEYLQLQGNFFFGQIPQKLASLKGLQHLDLSVNNLTGLIPSDFEKLIFLRYLNLSFNDLEGEVPINGVFGNASKINLNGNSRLCGGIPELQLPSCPGKRHGHENKNRNLVVIILMPTLLALILISIMLLSCFRKTGRRMLPSTIPSRENKILRISYHELHSATAGFSPENLVGSGNFGFVYKGRLNLHGDELVAVKVLDLQNNGASKSFKAECKALKNIRHRNLVSIITYCSSIDSRGQEFKALVYEFMENGSLDMWLHPKKTAETSRSRNLNLLQRMNIAIDVAEALHYLHNNCEVAIAHCDVKPSNILLDNDLTAHLGDFGLARLLTKTTNISCDQGTSTSSSAVAVKGSIGYAAPEYGMGSEASVQGDVYSYGIVLLEMLTGRRPTDDIFGVGLDLHKFVETNLPQEVMKITDSFILSGEIGEESRHIEPNDVEIELEENFGGTGNLYGDKHKLQKCLVSIFEIGLKCSAASPKDRMNVNEVIRELHHIKDAFCGALRNRAAF